MGMDNLKMHVSPFRRWGIVRLPTKVSDTSDSSTTNAWVDGASNHHYNT